MGAKGSKADKSSEIKKDEITEKDIKINDGMQVSYIQLFKYSNGIEKFMVFLGILGSVIQGCTLPYMIYSLADILEVFISLVINLAIKTITKIDDDNIAKELVEAIIEQTKNNTSKIEEFAKNHSEIDINKLMLDFQNSEYGSYDMNTGSFSYLTNNEIWDKLTKQLIIFAVIGIVSFFASYIYFAFLNISATRQATRIRSLVFRSILKQDITWHEKTNPGELSSRIISDTILIEDGIGVKIGTLIQSYSTFLACYILAFTSGWLLTLEMSVVFPILIIIGAVMGVVLTKFTKKSQDAYAVVGGIAQEAFSQIRTIVSFGTEQKEIDRYNEKLKPTRKYGIINANTFGASLGLIFCSIYCSLCIAFVCGTHQIDNGDITSGDVLKVFMCVMMAAASFSSSGSIMNAFGEATGAASKLFAIIERKPEVDTEAGEKPEKNTEGNIEFRDVCFNYPSRPDVEVLKGISFVCQPGHTVALVGASGSGKSTIVQLLERFYDKKSGQILIDGKNIEDYNIHWLRSQIGLVSQEPNLFDATIAENISLSRPNATQDEIETAAKLANAHEFILKLPNGYQTSTGERGLQLSGGQKQRICIARALMMNPKILLLDEATSALDNQSEKIVQAALESASAGRTTLVIAHRLTTVRNADCIIVMDKGIIVEAGTHDELMEKKDVYYNLVKNQEMKIKEEMENISDTDEDDQDEDQKLGFEKNVPTYGEITNMGRILSHTSFSRRNTTMSEMNKSISEKPIKGGKILASIDWKRYLEFNKPYWFLNLLGVIGAIFNGGIQPAYAFVFASALDVFNKHGEEMLDGGLFWGMMFVLLGVTNFFSFYFQIGGFSMAGEHLSYTLRSKMYDSMIRQEVGFFDTADIGDGTEANGGPGGTTDVSTGTLTAKLATEAGLVQGLNQNVGTIFQQLVTIIAGFTIAFICGWKLALILLISVPFLFVGSYLQMASMMDKNEEVRRIYENSSKVACEAIGSIKTVYALNLENYFDTLYEGKLREPEKRLERKYYISSIGAGFSNGIQYFAYLVGFYFGAKFVENGEMEFDNMFKVIMAVIFTALAAGQTSSLVPNYDKAVEAFGHVLEILDRKPKIDASDEGGCKKSDDEFKGEISFNNLRFRYPSRPKVTVLRMGEDKIEIPAGKMCAIVGGSGCGKSTIIGLLPRWYDPSHGTIVVDGENNKNYNIKWLREQIGIVNQEPSLFNISVKENIRYGKQDATDEEIIEAAKKANIHDFVMSLPEGYETKVGGIGTSKMSGGQKQRIAIARALVRNPKVLLLDEATSALDAESELIVQKALEEASEGRTTITIAHRLSTIKNAEVIVVMKDGRIEEMGNHETLMEKKGEYYNMVLAGDGSIQKGNEIAKKNA